MNIHKKNIDGKKRPFNNDIGWGTMKVHNSCILSRFIISTSITDLRHYSAA